METPSVLRRDVAAMDESSEWQQPADTMWERAGESGAKVWFLVSASRPLVITFLSILMYVLLVGMAVAGPTGFEQLLAGSSVDSVFGSVIIAVVTSVTLVLTVAQLVLSAQIDELGQHHESMEGEVSFRKHVADMAEIDVSPVEPNKFLQTLLIMVEDRARLIVDDVREQGDEEALAELLDSWTTSPRRATRRWRNSKTPSSARSGCSSRS